MSVYPFSQVLSTVLPRVVSLAASARLAARSVWFPSCFEASDLHARTAGDFGFVAPVLPDTEG